MRQFISVLLLSSLLISSSGCRIFYGKYHGMARADKQKMKAVARHNKAVARGDGCPATKEMRKQQEAKKKEEEQLKKKSQRLAK